MKYLICLLSVMCACVFDASLHSITAEQLQEYAINQNDSDLLEILMKYGDSDDNPVLNRAMAAKDYCAVCILIENGVEINSRTGTNGLTVLEMAIEFHEISLVEYFLMHKADPTNPRKMEKVTSHSPHRKTDFYTTAVYDAIDKDRLDILILFSHYGVDLNKPCYERTASSWEMLYKQSPLQVAIEKKRKAIASFLLSVGVDL